MFDVVFPLEKAAVFIDGGYFRKIIKTVNLEGKIDYVRLSEKMCSDVGANRLRTYYYDCAPLTSFQNKKNKAFYSRTQKFFDLLRNSPRFEVKLGRLQKIGGVFKQKMVDVHMSLDIADMAFEKYVDHVIIVAGDSDFVPAIQKAKNYGAIVHLFYDSSQKVHRQLKNTVDEVHTLTDDFLHQCKARG